MLPAGATTRTGRSAPPFAGIVGSVAVRSANATALTVTASTAFTLPGCCDPVPVKSNVAVSPSIVSATVIRTGFCWSARGPVDSITSVRVLDPYHFAL